MLPDKMGQNVWYSWESKPWANYLLTILHPKPYYIYIKSCCCYILSSLHASACFIKIDKERPLFGILCSLFGSIYSQSFTETINHSSIIPFLYMYIGRSTSLKLIVTMQQTVHQFQVYALPLMALHVQYQCVGIQVLQVIVCISIHITELQC